MRESYRRNRDTSGKYNKTLILAIFLGVFGVHRFVNGRSKSGLIMLFTFGGLGIWYVIDLLLIATGNFRDDQGRAIRYNGKFLKNTANVLALAFVISVFALGGIVVASEKKEQATVANVEVSSAKDESKTEESDKEENVSDDSESEAVKVKAANNLVEVDPCNTSGTRAKNVSVDVGYGDRIYIATTNDKAQLVSVTADELVLQNDQSENNGGDRYCKDEAKVKGVEEKNLDEGHVIADSLGGASNAYNITPQESKLNRSGEQAKMEKEIRNSLKNNKKVTKFSAKISYSDSSQIPSNYEYVFYVDGVKKTYGFLNTYTKSTSTGKKATPATTPSTTNTPSTKETTPATTTKQEVTYKNCPAVKAAGAAPIRSGDPGYGKHLDRDGDGVGCEK